MVISEEGWVLCAMVAFVFVVVCSFRMSVQSSCEKENHKFR
jgi:hypothetical protein